MTVAEVAALIMGDSDESDIENEENDDCDSDVASIFDETTADHTVHQDSDSDETDYHPSDCDAEIGPTDADDEEDEVASGIEPESSVRSTYKSKNPKVKWSKEPREIRGLLPKENIIQNKNIGPAILVSQHLNTSFEVSESVFKRDFIELILVNTNAKCERFYRQFPRSPQIMHFQGLWPFKIDEIIAFIGLSIIQGTYKLQKVDLSELYDCKQVLHFQATIL